MKKFILFSLVVALIGALVMPGSVAAQVDGAVVASETEELEFTAVEGITSRESQTIDIWNAGAGSLSWRVEEDVSWLSVRPSRGVSGGEQDDVRVRVNTEGLAAGVYEAELAISSSSATNSPQTVQVHLEVIEPEIMGPILIGIEKLWRADSYMGLTIALLLGEGGMDNLHEAAIRIDSPWSLSLSYENSIITGGTLRGGGNAPSGTITGGQLIDLGGLMPQLAGNSLVMVKIDTTGDGNGDLDYTGMLLTDLTGVLDLLPMLLGSVTSIDPDQGIISQEIIIPLGPILDILTPLLPVLMELLPTLWPIVEPLLEVILGMLPPIIILMPPDVMNELMEMLMGMVVGISGSPNIEK